MGATATDHGHLDGDDGRTSSGSMQRRCINGYYRATRQPEEQQLFQAQMLTEMAGMSVEDGLVMQLHPGSVRNHNRLVLREVRA